MQWISENREWNLEAVDEASQRFDLTPLEEEFLIEQFVRHQGIGEKKPE